MIRVTKNLVTVFSHVVESGLWSPVDMGVWTQSLAMWLVFWAQRQNALLIRVFVSNNFVKVYNVLIICGRFFIKKTKTELNSK